MNTEETQVEETNEETKAPAKKPAAKKKAAKKAAKKPAAKKAAKKAAAPKEKKDRFGSDLRITKIGENPRAKGSGAYKRFEDMRKFMTKNPKATVAEMLKGCSYLRVGFEKDHEREAFTVVKA